MSTITLPPKVEPAAASVLRLWLKRMLWALPISLALHFFFKSAAGYLALSGTIWEGHWEHQAWLFSHIAGGSTALLLGPLQFWTGLRVRYSRAHRLTGRLYMAGVVLAAGSAVYLSIGLHPEYGSVFATGTFVSAIAWLMAAAMAYAAIRRGQVKAHKEWMVRTYVLTFSFVVFRFGFDYFPLPSGTTWEEKVGILAWAMWSVPLFLAEVAIQWGRTVSPDRRLVSRATDTAAA